MIRKFVLLVSVITLAVAAPASAAKPGSGGGTTPPVKYVCIDPGHGGSDPGAIRGLVRESDLNLEVSLKVQEKLRTASIVSELTRTGDSTLSNNDRYTFCNNTPATTLVSIHHNGSTDPSVDYSLAMYQQNNSKVLAEIVGSSVATAVGNSSFSVTRYPSGVLIKSTMSSMMSEGYFLSNTNRLAQLNDAASRAVLVDKEAQAIVDGLVRYYTR